MTSREAMAKLKELGATPEGPVVFNEALIGHMCDRALEHGADEATVLEIRQALTADHALLEASGRIEGERFMADYEAEFGDEPS